VLENLANARRGMRTALVLGLLLALPSLGVGFFADDWIQRLALSGSVPEYAPDPWDLYEWTAADPVLPSPLMDVGVLAWWSHEEFHAHFFRPLSSLLLALDAWLFADSAFAAHLHSLLWYLVLIGGAAALFKAILPRETAVRATLVYAVAGLDASGLGWLAARHGMVAAAFGVAALLTHIRWRETGWVWGRIASPLLLIAALASSEIALGAVAFLAAYEMLGARSSGRERVLAATPSVLIALVYVWAYAWCDFGPRMVGTYVSPFEHPMAFAAASLLRVPVLAAELLTAIPSILFFGLPAPGRLVMAVYGLAAISMVATALYAIRHRLAEPERRAARWLAAGSLLSLLPLAGGLPDSRLLPTALLGTSVLIAVLLRHGRGGPRNYADPRQTLPRRVTALVGALALAHLGLSPGVRLVRPGIYARLAESSTRLIDEAEIPCQQGADVVVLPPVDPFRGGYSAPLALASPALSPKTWRVLSMAPFDHVIARTSESAFELRVGGGAMLTTPMEQLGRPPTAPLRAGDQVQLSRMRIRVLEVSNGGPSRVLFEFGRPLEDPGLCFVERRRGALREARIPEVGHERILPHRRFM
jgi:hypothetical protein